MTSMTYLKRIEPTLSPRKFVGQVLTWEWIARSLIDFLHGLLAEDLLMEGFPLEGTFRIGSSVYGSAAL